MGNHRNNWEQMKTQEHVGFPPCLQISVTRTPQASIVFSVTSSCLHTHKNVKSGAILK